VSTEVENQQQEPVSNVGSVTIEGADGQIISTDETTTEQEQRPLPEGINSYEELLDRFADLQEQSKGLETVEGEEESEEDSEEDTGGNDQEEGSTEEQSELEALRQQVNQMEMDKQDQVIYDMFGGKEEYEKAAEFFAQNLEQAQIDVLNAVFDSSDIEAKKVAAMGMQALIRQENGFEGQQFAGDQGGQSSTAPFKDNGEYLQALEDPRYYRNDAVGESYRQEVRSRMSSEFLNTGW